MRAFAAILSLIMSTAQSAAPLSLHMLEECATGSDVTIKLMGKDVDAGDTVSLFAAITDAPTVYEPILHFSAPLVP